MIAVINYQTSNLGSISNFLKRINEKFVIIDNCKDLKKFDKMILPGVGSFEKAMDNLKKFNWVENILSFSEKNKPILGICLGMQILFDTSEECENKNVKGLGLISGEVKKLKKREGFKVPHVGWNNLNIIKNSYIFDGIISGLDCYFIHSYKCVPKDKSHIVCTTEHSEVFPSVVIKKNIIGLQFHPEKSFSIGYRLIKNFCREGSND